jgi:hypothetical protein
MDFLLLNEKENRAAAEFMQEHYRRPCKSGRNAAIELFAEATGLGTSLKVRCPHCKKTQDITDIDCW